jgi:hypothetical protein
VDSGASALALSAAAVAELLVELLAEPLVEIVGKAAAAELVAELAESEDAADVTTLVAAETAEEPDTDAEAV